jgi:HlyD family secretion protein
MAMIVETNKQDTIAKTPAAAAAEATKKPLPSAKGFPRIWLLLSGGVVVAAAVLFFLLPPTLQVTQLATMRVRDEAVGVGYVQAKVPVSASAKINGVIRKVYVDQGDHVSKGQVLAQLENEDYQSQVSQAENQLQAAEAAVAAARAEASAAQARAQASRSSVARNQAGLSLARINYSRAKQLYETSSAVSKQDVDNAETSYAQAQEDVKNAEDTQRSLEQSVLAAEASVEAAQKNVSGVRAGLEFQRASLKYTIVTSPVNGFVVSRNLEEGGTVVPGMPIFTLAESKVIWVTAYVDEREIHGLRPGLPAQIVLRSRPRERIPGFVARIGQQADPVTEELPVDVSFTKPDPTVRLQETAEVYIQKAEHPEAAVLPVTALIPAPDGEGVWVVDDGRLAFRRVSVGITDKRGYAEILSGISPSDIIVIRPEASGEALATGKRVRTKVVPASGTMTP